MGGKFQVHSIVSGSQICVLAQVPRNSCLSLVEKREVFRKKKKKPRRTILQRVFKTLRFKQHWDVIHLDKYNIKAGERAFTKYL